MDFAEITVWYKGDATPRIELALSIFMEEVGRRSTIGLTRSPSPPAGGTPVGGTPVVLVTLDARLDALPLAIPVARAIRQEMEALAVPGPEGYRIVSILDRAPLVVVSGADEAGVLYGLGRLLRSLEMRGDRVTLPRPLRLSSTPRSALRGHQLGYRPKTNAYDMWTKDQYRQYIRELALFGANAIEILPPRTDDEPRTPDMLYDQLEMMAWLSGEIHSLGLAVWIWYPNMAGDLSVPENAEREAAEREAVYSTLPHVDAVLVPGGDPGAQEPSVLFQWCHRQSQILRRHHPQARIWISPQASDATPAWLGAFARELGREPEWLGGVCHGPWVKGNPAELRASVPPRYPIRLYPDITHTLSCQYPVRDWDPAFAATLGRECYNPRPLDYKRIQNAYACEAVGSISYSEGINDDVNKFVWSGQDWDPSTPVRETLEEYARLFISPDHAREIAEGILALERNWRHPVAANPEVHATYTLWRDLEERLPEVARANYRFVMPLMRACYDEYVRRRCLLERGIEERIVSVIESLTPESCDESLPLLASILAEAGRPREIDGLKQRCVELADRAFELIRWQTSVSRHRGQAVVRGCFLDAIDYPISDLPFYAEALDRAGRAPDPGRRCEVLRAALHRARPATRGRFVDLSSVEDREEVQKACPWDDDPSGLSLPYLANVPAPFPSYGTGGASGSSPPLVPVVERSYASTMYCRPLELRLEGLSPRARYRVRACYVSYRRSGGIKLSAGGRLVHDFVRPEQSHATVCYELPAGSVAEDGVLELSWQARPFRVYSEGVAWVVVEEDAG